MDQGNNHFDVVARHYHLYAFRQFDGASHVSSTEVELRTVAFEERSMTAAFVFGQDVHFRFELGVRVDGARLSQYLTTFDFFTFDTTSKAVDSDARLEAWQGGLVLSHTNDSGVNKVILRYSDNSDNSVYNKTDDLTTVYASFEGSHKFTQQAQVEYLLAFHDYDNGKDNTDNRKNYGAIVRPMYFWNDVHSTWLEAGYQRVDYDQGGDNHGWKLTLSQNIAIGMGPEFRPMLRFYVTGGQVDNEHTAKVNGTQDQQLDSLNVGGMFEAWF